MDGVRQSVGQIDHDVSHESATVNVEVTFIQILSRVQNWISVLSFEEVLPRREVPSCIDIDFEIYNLIETFAIL